MRKNMSAWGKDRWVPRAKLLKHLETGVFCPTRDGFLRKALVFSQRSRFRGFRLTHSELARPVMMFWQCNHPAFLVMSNLLKNKKWKFGSSVQMGQIGAGKHIPISMEIHGNHMGIHRISMVFEKLPEGETTNQSPKLRLPWRLIPIVWLSEICLSKCWFKREHVGYCWLFHNVKSAMLDIVDYVSFICLFYLCCSWFLWYLVHHLCACPKIE